MELSAHTLRLLFLHFCLWLWTKHSNTTGSGIVSDSSKTSKSQRKSEICRKSVGKEFLQYVLWLTDCCRLCCKTTAVLKLCSLYPQLYPSHSSFLPNDTVAHRWQRSLHLCWCPNLVQLFTIYPCMCMHAEGNHVYPCMCMHVEGHLRMWNCAICAYILTNFWLHCNIEPMNNVKCSDAF